MIQHGPARSRGAVDDGAEAAQEHADVDAVRAGGQLDLLAGLGRDGRADRTADECAGCLAGVRVAPAGLAEVRGQVAELALQAGRAGVVVVGEVVEVALDLAEGDVGASAFTARQRPGGDRNL